MALLDARAVDEDADLVAVGEDPWDERGHALGRAEVRLVYGGFAAESLDGVEGVGGCVVSLVNMCKQQL